MSLDSVIMIFPWVFIISILLIGVIISIPQCSDYICLILKKIKNSGWIWYWVLSFFSVFAILGIVVLNTRIWDTTGNYRIISRDKEELIAFAVLGCVICVAITLIVLMFRALRKEKLINSWTSFFIYALISAVVLQGIAVFEDFYDDDLGGGFYVLLRFVSCASFGWLAFFDKESVLALLFCGGGGRLQSGDSGASRGPGSMVSD
ncbi:hypothetical protein SDC9_148388 [bioreactor metagenome]|uniref:Uncharacterized protein n=1 Tax=bioreactor metagenome TaxID=1076179 RepID=A0A645EIT6_9ZZZZ